MGGTWLSAWLWTAKASVVLPCSPPASEQDGPELPPSFLGPERLGVSESGRPGDVSPEGEGGWGWYSYNLMDCQRVLQPGSSTTHGSPPSLQFLPPKKESACEKRGLSGPGVTTASPAPLPARVRRRHFLLLLPPPLFPGRRAGVVGRRSRRGGPLGSPDCPVTASPSPSLIPSTHWASRRLAQAGQGTSDAQKCVQIGRVTVMRPVESQCGKLIYRTHTLHPRHSQARTRPVS